MFAFGLAFTVGAGFVGSGILLRIKLGKASIYDAMLMGVGGLFLILVICYLVRNLLN